MHNPTASALLDMGRDFDAMNRTHKPTRHVPIRKRRASTLREVAPIVGVFLLAAWADGPASFAPLT